VEVRAARAGSVISTTLLDLRCQVLSFSLSLSLSLSFSLSRSLVCVCVSLCALTPPRTWYPLPGSCTRCGMTQTLYAQHTQIAAARQRAEKLREENLYLRDKPPNRSPTALRQMARAEHEKQPVHEHPSTRHNALEIEKAGVTDPATALSSVPGPQTTEHPRLVPLVLRERGGVGGGGGREELAVQRVQIRLVPEKGISSASAGARHG